MLAAIIKATAVIFGALPSSLGIIYGLIEASGKTGFDKAYPDHYKKLIKLYNDLLWLLVEHFIGLIITSVLLGTFWAFIVVEPKVQSKRRFEKGRRRRR